MKHKRFYVAALVCAMAMSVSAIAMGVSVMNTWQGSPIASPMETSNEDLPLPEPPKASELFSSQTDTVYLYNTGASQFLTAGTTWGMHAALGKEGLPIRATKNNYDEWQFYFYEGSQGQQLMFRSDDSNVYLDYSGSGVNTWTLTKIGNDSYRIQSSKFSDYGKTDIAEGRFVGQVASRQDVYTGEHEDTWGISIWGDVKEPESGNINWQFIKKVDYLYYQAKRELFELIGEAEKRELPTANAITIYKNTSATLAVLQTAVSELKTAIDSDNLQLIVSQADVPVSFNNGGTKPWELVGETVKNGNCGTKNSTSLLTLSYTSDLSTELTFDWRCNNYSSHTLYLYVDGIYKSSINNSNYESRRYYLEPGNHIILFRDSIGNSTSTNNYSYIKNIKVKEIKPLETAVLTENSEPLTFTNDGEWPWTIEDGYIQNSNYRTANSSSKFSTTFTIDKLSKFSFDRRVGYWNGSNITNSSSSYHYFRFKINGEQYTGCNYATSYGTISVALEPGTYTMEWQDTIYDNSWDTYYTQIRNIELSNNWVEVELAQAGTLGVEVLYKVDVLNDVEMIKVKGPINSTDWATIKQMKNLLAIDLTEAKFDAVPNNAFDGMSRVSNVKLPEGMKSIGTYAFRGTQLLNIDIPNSVTSIGEGAFYQTRVRSINFGEDSKLTTIGYQAFYQCTSLTEFIMPNTVTKLGTYNNNTDYRCYTFYGCTSLQKIHFSDGLTTLEQSVCYDNTKLTDVHLPSNLLTIRDYAFYNTSSLHSIKIPTTLNRIDYEAFYNCGLDSLQLPLKLSTLESYAFQECKNLKYIELPSYIGNYDYNFYGCTAVQTIVSRSATPPSITNDPFSGGRAKSAITLKVPSFAVVNYKLDSYWYQFGSIVEGDDIDYWKITSPLSLTNNRRMNGKPDIDLYYGGQFTVGGNAPMEIGQFNVFVSESNPARLLNTCEAMTADSLNTYFSVSSETWYFFTPLHDVDLSKVTVSNGASYVFRYYDSSSRATNGTGNSWRNVDDGKLKAGQGYIFRCNNNAVVTMPCEAIGHVQVLNTSDVTKPLTAYESTSSANKSWNYVGNPYPCYFDIYYMDFTAPITVWTGSTYKAYSLVDDNFALRPMQSFFVQKPDAVDNIVFHKEGRQLTSDINHASAVKANGVPAYNGNRHFFDLQIMNDDEQKDETRVVINNQASLDYELECDASKFMSFESNVPQMYTIDTEGNGYAMNERPQDSGSIALAYYTGKSGFLTISVTRADGDIYLYDRKMDKTVNLLEQDYMFFSDATEGTDASRFMLTLNVTDLPDGIKMMKQDTDDAVFDLSGRRILRSAKKGIYIQNGRKVVK